MKLATSYDCEYEEINSVLGNNCFCIRCSNKGCALIWICEESELTVETADVSTCYVMKCPACHQVTRINHTLLQRMIPVVRTYRNNTDREIKAGEVVYAKDLPRSCSVSVDGKPTCIDTFLVIVKELEKHNRNDQARLIKAVTTFLHHS